MVLDELKKGEKRKDKGRKWDTEDGVRSGLGLSRSYNVCLVCSR